MSATIAAALKKIAVSLLTNPKVLKALLGMILGIMIIIIMPIVAVVSVFNGNLDIDTNRLQEMVVQNLSAEEKSRLQFVEDTMLSIENKMKAAGFAGRTREAQVLYVLALSKYAGAPGFVDALVSCFSEDQTDEQIIHTVNSTFSTQLEAEDFSKVMRNIRASAIDISGLTDVTTKNNKDLVQWAIAAEKAGWGYVYGTYGMVLNKKMLASKILQYPNEVGSKEAFIRQNWLGKRTTDCVGLIKGYSWYDVETAKTKIGTNGMPDISANAMYGNAIEKGTIDTIPDIPGLAVWHEGHIGIYIGNGEVVQAANTKAGVIRNKLGDTAWTHWLKIPYINYIQEVN